MATLAQCDHRAVLRNPVCESVCDAEQQTSWIDWDARQVGDLTLQRVARFPRTTVQEAQAGKGCHS